MSTQSILAEFRKKFTYQDPIKSEGFRVVSSGLHNEKWSVFTSDQIEDFLEKAIEETKRLTLDVIADGEGWEDSRDYYAEILGVPLKYKKGAK